jgi:chromosomal replication initiation ATPase DnaA
MRGSLSFGPSGVICEELTRIRGEPRKLTIYLLKKYTGMPNRQIGEFFGGLSYSAVAKLRERFSAEMKKDRSLREQLERITGELSNVKG